MIKLYDGARSPNARKIRLLAAELQIPLELVRLDFAKGGYKTPEYLALNPNGKVPTIDDEGFVLWESGAIMKYLADKRPERGLLPADPKKRALLDQWLIWWIAHPETALLALAFERLIKPFLGKPGNDPSLVAAAQEGIDRHLPILDAQLAGKDYILGDLTIADFAAAPWLESAHQRLALDLGPYPNIAAHLRRMQQKPYWSAA